jgi:hypothetical protein
MNESQSGPRNPPSQAATSDPANAYEQQWIQGRQPDLDAFLAQAGPLAPAALAAVLRVDQRQCWQAGERVLAEIYLQRYPAILAEPDHAVDLIFNEFLICERLGDKPDASEYARRFPQYAEVLKAQIELHEALIRTAAQSSGPLAAGRSGAGDSFVDDEAETLTASGIRAGDMFGRYRIVQPLGRGGMAEVYLAEDTQLGRQVALKVPHFGIGADAELRQRFLREARIAATFQHPHLCPIFDVGQIDGVDYLTMPVLNGETLATRLKREGPFSARAAAQLTLLIARAVHIAHKADIIHRDLKPANVMLSETGEPIVMDFGLARRLTSRDIRLTATGMVLGTPAYIAPEQIGAEPDTLRPTCDVYSLGAMLYEMLTGALPFRGSVHEVLRQKLSQDPPLPSQLRPDLDPRLEAICLTAIAADATARFGSMEDFAAALDAYLQGKSDLPPHPRKGSPKIARKRLLAAGLACFGALLVGIVLWMVLHRSAVSAGSDGFQPGAEWSGVFRFRPPNQDYNGDVVLHIEQRDGERFTGLYSTERNQYVWRVRGKVHDGQIDWEFIEVIKEANPVEVVGNATVEGTYERGKMLAVFRHHKKQSTADMTLWPQP